MSQTHDDSRDSEDASGPRLVLTLGDWDEVKAFPAVSTTGPISGSTLNRPADFRHFNIHAVG